LRQAYDYWQDQPGSELPDDVASDARAPTGADRPVCAAVRSAAPRNERPDARRPVPPRAARGTFTNKRTAGSAQAWVAPERRACGCLAVRSRTCTQHTRRWRTSQRANAHGDLESLAVHGGMRARARSPRHATRAMPSVAARACTNARPKSRTSSSAQRESCAAPRVTAKCW